MDRTALEAYAHRSRAILESTPPTTKAETRAWLVTPLLSALGWDVRSDACETDRTIRNVDLEYVLSVGDGDTPALFVAVESIDASLRSGRERRLREAMAATGVDRAIYTDGRRLVLLAGPHGDDRQVVELASILDHADVLAHFSADALDRRLVRHARDIAARRLAVDRTALVASIASDLADVAGESYEAELRARSEQFLDELVRSFATTAEIGDAEVTAPDSRPDRSDASADSKRTASGAKTGATAGESTGTTSSDDTPGRQGESTADRSDAGASDGEWTFGAVEQTAAETDDRATRGVATDDRSAEEDEEGEYVVRFFGDQGKIGAVGASTSAGALVSAAEYLFERGLSGIRLPWGPDDGETVINEEPTTADGSRMPAYRGLSNGYYVNTAGSVEDRAERVAELTSRAGLRAMLSGDWELEE